MTELQPRQELSLGELARRIARRRWLLAGVWIGVFALVAAYTFMATPRYRSQARLRIETKTPGGGALDQVSQVPGASLLGLGRDELETEVAVLNSDRVADAAIDSLSLGIQLVTPAGNRDRILTARVVDPAMDVDGKLTLTREAQGRYRVEKKGLEEVRTLPTQIAGGDSVRVGGFLLKFDLSLNRGGPEKIVIKVLPRYEVHRLLEKRLLIARQEGGSRLVEVAYEDPDRRLAARVVDRIINEYLVYTTRIERTEDTVAVTSLRREVDSTARRLGIAESSLRSFEERTRLVAPEEQASAQIKRISAISAHVDAISVERNALARMLAIIGERSRGGADPSAYRQLATFPSLITNRAIQDLLQSLIDLENKRSALGVRRTEANEEYRQLTDRITEIQRDLYRMGPEYLESLDQQLATTAHAVTSLTDTLQAMPAAAMQYGRLVRDRTILEATYLALQKQLKQAELRDVLRQERVRIVDAPRVANIDDPVFPKKPVMLVLGAILGLALALTLALTAELSAPARPPESVS